MPLAKATAGPSRVDQPGLGTQLWRFFGALGLSGLGFFGKPKGLMGLRGLWDLGRLSISGLKVFFFGCSGSWGLPHSDVGVETQITKPQILHKNLHNPPS